ncbi:MAG: hydroxyacid dehydrogenase, partial [Chloroflexi bacterium]|nr:hydroxyacid dehydrogenase [Chloroflexota bacterium]
MNDFKVLIGSPVFGKGCPEVVEPLLAAGCQVIPNEVGRNYTEKELLQVLPGVSAIISGNEPLNASALAVADRLQVIARHGVGYDNVDVAAAAQLGIPVCIAAGTNHVAVAELALGLMLALVRHVPRYHADLRAGQWTRYLGSELQGKVLGLVGLGRIG